MIMQLKCSNYINVSAQAVFFPYDRHWFYRDFVAVLVYAPAVPGSVQTPYSDKPLVFCIVQIQSAVWCAFVFPPILSRIHKASIVSQSFVCILKALWLCLKKKRKKKNTGWWYMDLSLYYPTSIQQALTVCVKGWENPLFAKQAKVDLTGWKWGSSGYILVAQTGIQCAYKKS